MLRSRTKFNLKEEMSSTKNVCSPVGRCCFGWSCPCESEIATWYDSGPPEESLLLIWLSLPRGEAFLSSVRLDSYHAMLLGEMPRDVEIHTEVGKTDIRTFPESGFWRQ